MWRPPVAETCGLQGKVSNLCSVNAHHKLQIYSFFFFFLFQLLLSSGRVGGILFVWPIFPACPSQLLLQFMLTDIPRKYILESCLYLFYFFLIAIWKQRNRNAVGVVDWNSSVVRPNRKNSAQKSPIKLHCVSIGVHEQ